MWSVYEKKILLKKIRRLPKSVLQRYEVWKSIVELEGLTGLRAIKGLHDEALSGEWKGFRSSRLNKQWRVIYTIKNNACEVYVIDINSHTSHAFDYKRG